MQFKGKTIEKEIDVGILLEKIAEKANEIYHERQRNHTPGDDISDWLKAEKIIKKEENIK